MSRTIKERLETIREAEKRKQEHEREWKEAKNDVQKEAETGSGAALPK